MGNVTPIRSCRQEQGLGSKGDRLRRWRPVLPESRRHAPEAARRRYDLLLASTRGRWTHDTIQSVQKLTVMERP